MHEFEKEGQLPSVSLSREIYFWSPGPVSKKLATLKPPCWRGHTGKRGERMRCPRRPGFCRHQLLASPHPDVGVSRPPKSAKVLDMEPTQLTLSGAGMSCLC